MFGFSLKCFNIIKLKSRASKELKLCELEEHRVGLKAFKGKNGFKRVYFWVMLIFGFLCINDDKNF